MAKVPRYSRSARVVTEVQPSYTPASAESAKMFETVKQGFDAGVKFLRPAVEQEQTALGEKKATEAFENDEFEMRKPFTIRDAAFNATGERLVTNRAMIELDEGFRAAMKDADGNMRKLEANLQELSGQRGEMPEIPGLQTKWLESFERGAATARRQTTELAERRAIARARQAAADAANAAASETERLALTAGTPEDVAAAITAGVDNIAQFGPTGAFTVNGVEYPADPSRQGILTPRQVQSQADALASKAHRTFLEADYMRSDDKGAWAANWTETVLDNRSPLPPGASLDMAAGFERRARADESARLREENRLAAELQGELNNYVVANEAGILVAVPDDVRTDALERAAGSPELTMRVQSQLAAADAVVALHALNPDQRPIYIENQKTLAGADGVISPQEAATITTLEAHLKAIRQAYTRETTGVSAAEQLTNSGVLLSDDAMSQMVSDANASGKPALIEAAAVVAEAQGMLDRTREMSGVEREELLNRMTSGLETLIAEGEAGGLQAQRQIDALEMAKGHLEELGRQAENEPTKFAKNMGIELEAFPTDPEAGVGEIVAVIGNRIAAVQDVSEAYGNATPVPLTGSEKAALTEFVRNAVPSARVAVIEQIYDAMPRANANAVLDSIGAATPELRTAARLADSAPAAMTTVMAGIGVTIRGDTDTNRAAAEANVLSPFLRMFSTEGRERIMGDATAYARGKAAQDGQTELQVADIERGIDYALGANEDGVGGIEQVQGYGMAILPTGVSGREVSRAWKSLGPTQAFDLFGGNVTDRYGETFSTREVVYSTGSFAPDPMDPSRLMILDDRGDAFMVTGPDGTRPATFSIKELIGG